MPGNVPLTILDYRKRQPPPWPRHVREWVRALVPFAVAILVIVGIGIAWFAWIHRDRRIAIIAGPDGKPAAYELWWNPLGDLRLLDTATKAVVASKRDYYEDLAVVSLEWETSNTAVLTTREGIVLRIDLQLRAMRADRSGWRLPGQSRSLTGEFPTTTPH